MHCPRSYAIAMMGADDDAENEQQEEQEAMESKEMQQESGKAAMADSGIETAEVPADAGDQPTDDATASAAVAAEAAAAPETSAAIESGHDSYGERTDHHDGDGESSGSEGEATTKTMSWAEESERAFRQPRAY